MPTFVLTKNECTIVYFHILLTMTIHNQGELKCQNTQNKTQMRDFKYLYNIYVYKAAFYVSGLHKVLT